MRSFGRSSKKRDERAPQDDRQRQGEPPAAEHLPRDADLPEDRIVGVIEEVDDAMATVLVGADEVEYSFPMGLLSNGAQIGTMPYLVLRDDRLEVIGERLAHKAELGGAVQDRLKRGINQRRLRDMGNTSDT